MCFTAFSQTGKTKTQRKANETGKLYEEDIVEIKQMHNEQTKFLKKILEAVMYLYEEDSKKKK